MEDLAKILQALMSNTAQPAAESAAESASEQPDGDSGEDNFGSFFENIDFDMVMKMGDMFSKMNQPDSNSEFLLALRPHLRPENRHKIDSAVKMSKMMSLLPFLKESGILKNLL